MFEKMLKEALQNFRNLAGNDYPGRGIVFGESEDKKNIIQLYWIMGRSENSRNRIFEKNDYGKIWTSPADPSKVKDPSLIIYTAMDSVSGLHAVSNGAQTDDIINAGDGLSINAKEAFREAMFKNQYEPDNPNFTPRISAVYFRESTLHYAEMSIIKKSPWSNDAEYHFYPISEFIPGIGLCVTTYDGPGDPLPAFSGVPYPLPLIGNIDDIMTVFWDALNPDNRISMAAKFIEIATGKSEIRIINAY